MIRVFCDICNKELRNVGQPPHLCERCAPFAEEYYTKLTENAYRQAESFRQRFLQQTVLKQQTRPLEAVK